MIFKWFLPNDVARVFGIRKWTDNFISDSGNARIHILFDCALKPPGIGDAPTIMSGETPFQGPILSTTGDLRRPQQKKTDDQHDGGAKCKREPPGQ